MKQASLGQYSSKVEVENEENFYEAKVEEEPVMEMISFDIYEENHESIREILSNAIASVLDAEEMGLVDDGKVEVVYYKDENGENDLVIRDNGVGLTEERFKAIKDAGLTTNRKDTNKAGQFGVGFYSAFQLVGTDGGFYVHTNPRIGDRGNISYSRVMKGFKELEESTKERVRPLGENEHGTKIEIPLDETVEASEVVEAVQYYSEFSRVPVSVRVVNSEGDVSIEEEYGNKSLEEAFYRDNYTVVETDYYKAVYGEEDRFRQDYPEDKFDTERKGGSIEYENETFNEIEKSESGKTILLDVPIRRNHETDLEKSLFVRLKTESPTVIYSSDEEKVGCQVVSDAEYRSTEDDEDIIPESWVSEDDIVTPNMSSTRRELERNISFWSSITRKVTVKYYNMIRNTCSEPSSLPEAVEMNPTDYHILVTSDYDKMKKKSNGDVMRFVQDMKDREEDIHKYYYNDYHTDGQVYMYCRKDPLKVEAIKEDNGNNMAFEVDNHTMYDEYDSRYGWEELHSVPNKLGSLDISEELKEKISDERVLEEKAEEVLERELNVHYNSSGRESEKMKIKEIIGDNTSYVVFTHNGDENISDNYEIARKENYAVLNCNNKEKEHLIEGGNIMGYEEFEEQMKKTLIETPDGEVELGSTGRLAVFLSDEDVISEIRNDDELFDDAREYFREITRDEELEVSVMTEGELREIYPIKQDSITVFDDVEGSENTVFYEDKREGHESLLRAYHEFSEWRDSDTWVVVREILKRTDIGSDSMTYEFLRKVHEEGLTPL